MDNKNFKSFLERFFLNFDICDLNNCQTLIYILFNNKIILKEQDKEVNQIINENIKKIGEKIDLNLINKNTNDHEQDPLLLDFFLPMNFIF